jgi:hypothetical protein
MTTLPLSLSADTRDGALTSNNDFESISARASGADSDSDEDDSSAMRTFTAARLDVCDHVAEEKCGDEGERFGATSFKPWD